MNRMQIHFHYRSLISLAIVRKACSTFIEFLAEVSRNGIPNCWANSCQNEMLLTASPHNIRITDISNGILDDLLISTVCLVSN